MRGKWPSLTALQGLEYQRLGVTLQRQDPEVILILCQHIYSLNLQAIYFFKHCIWMVLKCLKNSIVKHHNESHLCLLIFLLTALNKHVLSPLGSLKAYSLIMLINSYSTHSTCSPHSQLPAKKPAFQSLKGYSLE